MRTGRYSVRKSLYGKAILQAEYNSPILTGNAVDASIRDIYWEDIPYEKAPLKLRDHEDTASIWNRAIETSALLIEHAFEERTVENLGIGIAEAVRNLKRDAP